MTGPPTSTRQLQSLVTAAGRLELRLVTVGVPEPGPDEVVVRVEASPINPSDLGLLLAGADPATFESSGPADDPVVTATIPEAAMGALAGRVGQSLPVGNEGAGVVVAAGSSAAAQGLLGRTVGMMGGSMYSRYRCLPAAQCLALPDGTAPAAGASCFVNPLTALGMVETMRLEGHTALVHTAAASNLGRMLVRICQEDGVELVNVVRRPEQVQLLQGLGARYVCDSSAPSFTEDLTGALASTSATVAFDAIGGGRTAGRILACMEAAILRSAAGAYSRYGSAVHKQVYLYGGLDRGPTELERTFGMAWGIGGWLLPNFLARVGPDVAQRLRRRVVDGLTTTFASHYTKVVSLTEALRLSEIDVYRRQATGEKYLIDPSR
jgi:NADPH:quinone reductase